MKLAFNKYWMIVALITIINIFIFIFLSNKLESYVIETTASNNDSVVTAV